MATEKPKIKAKATASSKSTPSSQPSFFMFTKENYILMLAGIVVIIVGFLLMLGKNNTDPSVFPADEIYSFRRITLAPIVVMIGFGIEVLAILKKPKEA